MIGACACSCGGAVPFPIHRGLGRLLRVRAEAVPAGFFSEGEVARLEALKRIDEALCRGDERLALSLARDLKAKDGGGLLCFGAARQVPRRLYSLKDLKLNGIDTSCFLSPVDLTLSSIERNLQLAAVLGGISAWSSLGLSQLQVLLFSLLLLFLWSLDLVYYNGGVRNLALDTIGHRFSKKYRERVVQHESGHFLVAYLLGVLPKGYTITSLETLASQGSLNVQAGTAFVDYEFLEEVATGKLSASMLDKFSCIALAGVATEYLLYGRAEGGLADIDKLDGLLKGVGFTQKKADSQVRWAVLNTVTILRRHSLARQRLAEAMEERKSVGLCINIVEKNIDAKDM